MLVRIGRNASPLQTLLELVLGVVDNHQVGLQRKDCLDIRIEQASNPGPPGPGGSESKRLLTRYVTFNHGDDKYYLVLRSPSERFSADEDSFADLLKRFSFD